MQVGLIVRTLVLLHLSWRVELSPTNQKSCYQASDRNLHELTIRFIDMICAFTRILPLDPLLYIRSLMKARILKQPELAEDSKYFTPPPLPPTSVPPTSLKEWKESNVWLKGPH